MQVNLNLPILFSKCQFLVSLVKLNLQPINQFPKKLYHVLDPNALLISIPYPTINGLRSMVVLVGRGQRNREEIVGFAATLVPFVNGRCLS